MGCGTSKSTVEAPSQKQIHPTSQRLNTYSNIVKYKDSIKVHEQTVQNQPFASSNTTTSDNDFLPPPRPPDQTLEEILAGKEDLIRRSDQHAQAISFDNAVCQELKEFTDQTLIPKGTIEEKETVQIVNSQGDQKVVTQPASPRESESTMTAVKDGPTKNGRSQHVHFSSPPVVQPTEKYNADAAELLLEKYKRDRDKAEKLMMVDKMRHNITLQDKLAKRKEMKRKAAMAQGSVVSGEVSVAAGSMQLTKEGAVRQTETAVSTQLESGTIAAEASTAVAFDGATLDGEVEATQDKYAAVMAEVAPEPAAPETRKEAIYRDEDNIELFRDLEEFAVNMEQISSPETTFAVLMKSLLINQLSDLEKVRILFHWITKQDLNSINFPSNLSEDTPMGFLYAIKNNKKTYAELFSRLCSAAGLHAKVIVGYLKGVGYLPDYKFIGSGDPFRGSWNAVLINGQWRLIDTHWGARHVIEEDDSVSTEVITVYRYEEHYFLTNPDQLIVTHFPDEKDWQLLREPITLEEFQDFTKLWPLHFKLKLGLFSHPNGVIIAPSDGTVEIRIKMSDFARRDAEFKFDFMTKTKQRKVGNNNLACCVFHYTENEYQVFRVCCPATGEYLLKIFGLSEKFSDENLFTNIALYQINCPKLKTSKSAPKDQLNVKVSEISAPFPEVIVPWGPPAIRRAHQILPMSHTGPIICCDKIGEATLVMEMTSKESLNFLQHLFSAKDRLKEEKKPLENRAIHFTTTSTSGRNVVVFRIRTPERGNYFLSLYMNAAPEGQFNGFCNYFVVSAAQSHPAPPFPNVHNGALGENQENCLAINTRPTSYPSFVGQGSDSLLHSFGNAWIGLTTDNEGYVIMEHLKLATIIATLERQDGGNLERNVLVEDTGKRAVIAVRPPIASNDSLEFVLKVYAAPVGQTSNIPPVLASFIPGSRKEQKLFPLSPGNRWGPNPSQASYGLSLVSVSNSSPLFNIDANYDSQDPSPCRLYHGGGDMIIKLSMRQHLALLAKLSVDQKGAMQNLEGDLTFFSEITSSDATLGVQIPKEGDYCLTIYGSLASSASTQHAPLLHVLIRAASGTPKASYPRTFAMWNSGLAKLHSPANGNLARNTVNKIKVTFADVSEGETKAFPRVILLTEQSHAVEPNVTDVSTFMYEWDYVPGPGEKMISLAAQTSSGKSLNYVLQFQISD